MSGIDILFNTHVGALTEGQLQLQALIEGQPMYSLDMDQPSGQLRFGEESFDMQLIGTESYLTNTWLWAWANRSDLPADLLQMSFRMHMHGAEFGATDLTEPEHPLSYFDGHTASVAIAGTVGMQAYYRCAYEGGALFVAISDRRLQADERPELRYATYLSQALQMYAVSDQHRAAVGYAEHLGFEPVDKGNVLRLIDRTGVEVASVTFDELGRLGQISTTAAA